MHISDDRIIFMLKKVAVLREQMSAMCLGKPDLVISVMDLHYVVEQVYSLKIEMIEVSFAAVYLRGKVERYEDGRARVLVRSGVSETDKRLATVKELCHLVLDEKDDWSTDGVKMIEDIMSDSRAKTSGQGQAPTPSMPLESEALALMAAGEIMYPSEYRVNDAAKLAADQTTISAIALQHDVPGFVVEDALKKEPLYSALREAALGPLGIAAE
jgi:hypothetical protein